MDRMAVTLKNPCSSLEPINLPQHHAGFICRNAILSGLSACIVRMDSDRRAPLWRSPENKLMRRVVNERSGCSTSRGRLSQQFLHANITFDQIRADCRLHHSCKRPQLLQTTDCCITQTGICSAPSSPICLCGYGSQDYFVSRALGETDDVLVQHAGTITTLPSLTGQTRNKLFA